MDAGLILLNCIVGFVEYGWRFRRIDVKEIDIVVLWGLGGLVNR